MIAVLLVYLIAFFQFHQLSSACWKFLQISLMPLFVCRFFATTFCSLSLTICYDRVACCGYCLERDRWEELPNSLESLNRDPP